MSRTGLAFCAGGVFAVVAAVGAQQSGSSTAGPPAGTATTTASSAAADATHTTLTGCLTRENNGTFKLTNAQAASTVTDRSVTTGAGAATTTSGANAGTTAGTSGSKASMASTWILEGRDLDRHVGHKIQVTGREHEMATAPPAATTGQTPSTTTASSESGRRLDVQSLQMIATSCP